MELPDQPRASALVHRPRPRRASAGSCRRIGRHRAHGVRDCGRSDPSGLCREGEGRSPQPLSHPAAPSLARPERHVLLLDRLWLSPDWRGQGLGPVVAAAAIERLGRGCDLAACYPAPFEDLDPQPDVRQRAVEVLGRIWSKVGFTEWNDGVWMIDLSTDDVHAALVALIDARTVAS